MGIYTRACVTEVETAEDVLMSQGIINRAEVDEIHHLILEKGIELPLHWERGSWKFQEREEPNIQSNRSCIYTRALHHQVGLECDRPTSRQSFSSGIYEFYLVIYNLTYKQNPYYR